MTITITMLRGILTPRACAQGGLMRGALELVGQALERRARPGVPLESRRDQVIGEPGVLGQQRAVQVGADQIETLPPLPAVPVVVPVSVEDPAERVGRRAQVGAAAVILEAG